MSLWHKPQSLNLNLSTQNRDPKMFVPKPIYPIHNYMLLCQKLRSHELWGCKAGRVAQEGQDRGHQPKLS